MHVKPCSDPYICSLKAFSEPLALPVRSQAAEEAIRRMAEAEDKYEKVTLPEIKRLTTELATAEAKLKVCRPHPSGHSHSCQHRMPNRRAFDGYWKHLCIRLTIDDHRLQDGQCPPNAPLGADPVP